jgi:hypothetical protein
MPRKPEAFRDWHRLFGLLLTDFFTDSPFSVELEEDEHAAGATLR